MVVSRFRRCVNCGRKVSYHALRCKPCHNASRARAYDTRIIRPPGWERRLLLLQSAAEQGIPLERVVGKRQPSIGTAIVSGRPKRCSAVHSQIDPY